MAAISSKFVADFSQWKAAVASAQGDLSKFGAAADTAAAQVAKLTDAGAGRFAVTTAEMKAAGIATQDWTKDFQQFDSVLSSVGINVGTQAKAIGELGAAAGQTGRSMSVMGEAGLVAGAAIAGWQIGRWIADVFDLDQKIAGLTGSLEALKAQEAGAQQDTINKAIRDGAAATITYTEAIKFNNKAHEDAQLVAGASANAAGDAGRAYAGWYREIRQVRERGDLERMTADLQSHDFKLDTLSKRYGVHVEALEFYSRELKKAADLEKEQTQALEAKQKALDAAIKADWAGVLAKDTEYLKLQTTALQSNLDLFNKRVAAEWDAQKALAELKSSEAAITPDSLEGITAAYETLQTQLQATGGTAAQQEVAYLNYQNAFVKAADAAGHLGTEVQKSGDQTSRAAGQAAGAVSSYQQLAGAVQYAAGSFQNMYTAVGHGQGYESDLRTLNDMASAYGRAGIPVVGGLIPGARAAGGPVSSGSPYWVGEGGPELFVPRASGSIVPAGGGAPVINVYGSVLSTKQELAALVQEAIMASYRAGGNRLPA